LVKINEKGAEICSVMDKTTGFEFIWNADPQIWNRHAPVLFPIVGKLNNNKIEINKESYSMNQHGFARDLLFEPIEVYSDLLKFMLTYSDQTLELFPYKFRFFITYELVQSKLTVSYTCLNLGEEPMYYSVGAHPGFSLPSKDLAEYSIVFEKPENLDRHLLTNGLLNSEIEHLGENISKINLNNELFSKDAIILKNLNSSWLKLVQTEKNYAIKLNFDEFAYMGIWAKVDNSDFICLEPWNGIADSVGFTGDISLKEGILKLEAGAEQTFSYSLEFTMV
jgi:galactose mutarotase-like enzyme